MGKSKRWLIDPSFTQKQFCPKHGYFSQHIELMPHASCSMLHAPGFNTNVYHIKLVVSDHDGFMHPTQGDPSCS